MVVLMATAETLLKKFGPLLLEATVRTQVDESNRLREKLALPAITAEDVINEIESHLNQLEPYPWMIEDD